MLFNKECYQNVYHKLYLNKLLKFACLDWTRAKISITINLLSYGLSNDYNNKIINIMIKYQQAVIVINRKD